MDKIIIVDFGSQYTQLIARRIRELGVYSEIIAFRHKPTLDVKIKGIILSGSPASVNQIDAPDFNFDDFAGQIPILGICYGAQLTAKYYQGKVAHSSTREYGRANIEKIQPQSLLLQNVCNQSHIWMSHGDSIEQLPAQFEITARSQNGIIASFENPKIGIYGVQFHPEVTHTEFGATILQNFVQSICQTEASWKPESFIEASINEIQTHHSNSKVICALSGGVDSSVTATLLNKVIPHNLHCIFVDTGLLRKNEAQFVMQAYAQVGLKVELVNAQELFLAKLSKVFDPEEKRKIIGNTFIEVFEAEAQKLKGITHLAQGTIYPDVIESSGVNGTAQVIKSHHNVGGLPDKMNLQVLEPLRLLFKDEVRKVGLALGLPKEMIERHPFPGPGLGIRILGEITTEKVRILQEADNIFIQLLHQHQLYSQTWQAFAVLLPVQSVGVMGDERTYENVLVLRAVTSIDGMTADWARLPYEFIAEVSNVIINKVRGINRVVYDISSKPPATIEWE